MTVLIVTRYNLPLKFATQDQPVMDNQWLSHRRELFLRYCLPSVCNQVDTNFVWAIGFSKSFDDPAVLGALPKNARPLFCADGNDFKSQLSEIVNSLERDGDLIITTRLDNDDALAHNFISTINSFSSFAATMMSDCGGLVGLNFRSGAEYDVDNGLYYAKDYPSSSFVTLYTSPIYCHDKKTVLDYHHAWMYKDVNVVNVPTSNPMWCIVIHDKNVGNKVSGVFDDGLKDRTAALFGFSAVS